MSRCGRLIIQEAEPRYTEVQFGGEYDTVVTYEMYNSLEEGDIQTGFEIISGLPLEEQTRLDYGNYPKAMRDYTENLWGEKDHHTALYMALGKKYRYNGKEWEVADNEL